MQVGPGNGDQHGSDGDVDQRTRDRDQEFLVGFFGDALQPCDAADRQQRDVGRRDAEGAGGEDVAELMCQHAGKEQDQEEQRIPRRVGAAGGIARAEYPGEEQHEGDVDADGGARDRSDIQ